MKLAASGCPRNCAEATVKDVGVVAVDDGWEIYVGGAAGAASARATCSARSTTQEEVLLYTGRFMQYYREHGKYLERTSAFVERIGIDRVREILVDDADGIGAELDAEIQAAVDAYGDPWLEARRSRQPAQLAHTC